MQQRLAAISFLSTTLYGATSGEIILTAKIAPKITVKEKKQKMPFVLNSDRKDAFKNLQVKISSKDPYRLTLKRLYLKNRKNKNERIAVNSQLKSAKKFLEGSVGNNATISYLVQGRDHKGEKQESTLTLLPPEGLSFPKEGWHATIDLFLEAE